jgi:hypothetical protein
VTVDELAVKHAVISIEHDQLARPPARGAQIPHACRIVERLARDPLALVWQRDLPVATSVEAHAHGDLIRGRTSRDAWFSASCHRSPCSASPHVGSLRPPTACACDIPASCARRGARNIRARRRSRRVGARTPPGRAPEPPIQQLGDRQRSAPVGLQQRQQARDVAVPQALRPCPAGAGWRREHRTARRFQTGLGRRSRHSRIGCVDREVGGSCGRARHLGLVGSVAVRMRGAARGTWPSRCSTAAGSPEKSGARSGSSGCRAKTHAPERSAATAYMRGSGRAANRGRPPAASSNAVALPGTPSRLGRRRAAYSRCEHCGQHSPTAHRTASRTTDRHTQQRTNT